MNKIKIMILSFFSIIFLSLSILGGIETAEAGFFCDNLGTDGITPKIISSNIRNVKILENMGNRQYTFREIFSIYAYSYSIPHADDDGDWWRAENHYAINLASNLSSDEKDLLKTRSQDLDCYIGKGFSPAMTSISQRITDSISFIIKYSVNTFFNSKFICDNPDDPHPGDCINLLKLVGGKRNGNGGMIGVFSKGLFLPLSVLAFIFVAAYIGYKGLVKREFRASIGGLVWALFVFVLGIFVLLNPWMIARAPHTINTTINSCIISAMNGDSCLGNSKTTEDYNAFVSPVCASKSNKATDFNDKLQLQMNSLTCMITKGFTLDRWAEQQFGYSFDELYTVKPNPGWTNSLYPKNKLVGLPEDYCVNMYSSQSPKEFADSIHQASPVNITNKENSGSLKNEAFFGKINPVEYSKIKTIVSDSNNIKMEPNTKVCNIALAYISNRTIGNYGTKANMGHIIATAAKDNTMWGAFSGHGRDILGTFSILGSIAAAVAFIPVALYGHAYSLTATILMIFAPMFMLLGIHPGKGRKIFLGWLESIISACLKFMATSLLILVMIMMFSIIMGSMHGVMVFISSLILCFTFISYRKELVNLVGATSMGGSKMSNKAASAMEKVAKKTGYYTAGAAGGALGGAIAGAKQGDGFAGSIGGAMKGMGSGLAKGVGMEMRKGRGIIANATRGGNQVTNQLRREREKYEKQADSEARRQDSLREIRENKDSVEKSMMLQAETVKKQNAINSEILKQEILNRQDSGKQNAINSSQKLLDQGISKIQNPELAKQASNYRNELNNVSEISEIKQTYEQTENIITEARIIENYIGNNGKANEGKAAYLEDFKAKEEEKLFNDFYNISKQLEKTIDLPQDKIEAEKMLNNIIQPFVDSQTKNIERTTQELSNNISTITKSKGVSILNEVSLKDNVKVKDEYNIAYEKNSQDFFNNLEKIIENVKAGEKLDKKLPDLNNI